MTSRYTLSNSILIYEHKHTHISRFYRQKAEERETVQYMADLGEICLLVRKARLIQHDRAATVTPTTTCNSQDGYSTVYWTLYMGHETSPLGYSIHHSSKYSDFSITLDTSTSKITVEMRQWCTKTSTMVEFIIGSQHWIITWRRRRSAV